MSRASRSLSAVNMVGLSCVFQPKAVAGISLDCMWRRFRGPRSWMNCAVGARKHSEMGLAMLGWRWHLYLDAGD